MCRLVRHPIKTQLDDECKAIYTQPVEDIREMGKTPETPNPNPEREMGKREKKPRNQRGKWEKEENGKRKREGEPNGVTTPLPSSKNRDVLCAMG